jgi:hypothetical protein
MQCTLQVFGFPSDLEKKNGLVDPQEPPRIYFWLISVPEQVRELLLGQIMTASKQGISREVCSRLNGLSLGP